MRRFARYMSELCKKSLMSLLTFSLVLSGFAEASADENTDRHATGLQPLSEGEKEYIRQCWPHVVGVRTNKIGAHRINEHITTHNVKAEKVFAPDTSIENEFIMVIGSEAYRKSLGLDALSIERLDPGLLPRHVDNTQLPSFPPIGNQQQLGSCAAWATTYYQASHEIGMLNGVNNHTSQQGILSPKWTYNLLNGGQDGGLVIMNVYDLLSQQGATGITNFPYDADFLAWDLNPQDWIHALSNRTTQAHAVDGVDGTPEQLQLIKEMLNNGHVFVVGTWAYSWQMTKVSADPAATSNPYAGQQAISWLKGREGGHAVTIVGYDDDVWIDINGNGQVDPGEKGAFLVANQWNTDWGNNGLIWVSYDAFRAVSAVSGGPNTDRVPFADITDSQLIGISPKGVNYKPSLIAQFTLNQELRDQISIFTGVSDTTTTNPTQTTVMAALNRSGGDFEFDGNNPQKTTSATFVADLSDLIASAGTAPQRFYLIVNDSTRGNPTTLLSYSLIDVVRGTQTDCFGLPVSCDNSTVTKYIDYDLNLPVPPQLPSVTINSPIDGSTVGDNVQVVVQATSNVGISHVDFYVNGKLTGTATSAPYLFSVDTRQLPGGRATFRAVAFDQQQQQAESSVTVNLSNFPTSYHINCGGGAVTGGSIQWSPDGYFQGQSVMASTTFPFANPVYATQRVGNFSYNFPVKNGHYLVTLKFAEFSPQAARHRTFDVILNTYPVISNLSLYRQAGFGRSYDRSFLVTVVDNNIHIHFAPVGGQAVINAITITQQ